MLKQLSPHTIKGMLAELPSEEPSKFNTEKDASRPWQIAHWAETAAFWQHKLRPEALRYPNTLRLAAAGLIRDMQIKLGQPPAAIDVSPMHLGCLTVADCKIVVTAHPVLGSNS